MIHHFIAVFGYFIIGFALSNILRLRAVRKQLIKARQEVKLISNSDLPEETKIISLNGVQKSLDIIDAFSYFSLPLEIGWKERRIRRAKVRKIVKALKRNEKNKIPKILKKTRPSI